MPFFKFAKQADAHYQYPERGMTAHGATLSFPRGPAKVPSPSPIADLRRRAAETGGLLSSRPMRWVRQPDGELDGGIGIGRMRPLRRKA